MPPSARGAASPFEHPVERLREFPERLFRLAFRAVSLEGRCRLPTRAGPGTAPVPRLLAAELQDLSKVRLLRGFGTRRRRCLVESSLRELRVAVQALR